MTRELIVTPEAEADIAEARDWYEERVFGLGMGFVLAVRATISEITQNPFQYQIVWQQYRRAGVARFPYGLMYGVSDDEITVLRVFMIDEIQGSGGSGPERPSLRWLLGCARHPHPIDPSPRISLCAVRPTTLN